MCPREPEACGSLSKVLLDAQGEQASFVVEPGVEGFRYNAVCSYEVELLADESNGAYD